MKVASIGTARRGWLILVLAVLAVVTGPIVRPEAAHAAGFACQNRDTGDHQYDQWLARRWCLYPNDRVVSAPVYLPGALTVNYRLIYQTDGNIVLYEDLHSIVGTRSTALWGFNMIDPNFHSYPLGYLAMQTDGNLVLYDGRGTPRFQSNTYRCNAPASLKVQTDANAVIYRDSGGNFNPNPAAATWKIEGKNHRLVHLAC